MNRASRRAIVPALCVLLLAWPAAGAEEETPELELKPCTIELVDGTEVEGRLAVQFEMDDHLIVYSPGLGTVRSFLRDHIHALTVDGKREALNPKRELTEEDRELLGRMDWPDTPPAEGPKPAYTTETWGKPKRLLVWANPGVKNLRAENPSNWLLNGRPVESFEYTPREPFVIDEDSGQSKDVSALFDTDTDVLIPVSRKTYRIVYRSEKANIALQCRHLTTDVNAMFRPRNLSRMTGNLWNRGGRGCMSGRKWIRFTGDKHTFIINNVDHPGLAPEPVGSGLSYLQTIFAHEIYFDKGKGSVHLFGPLAAKYHMKALTGTVIVGRDAMLMYASDTPFTVAPDAVIELRSGGIVAYRGTSSWGRANEENDYRMILRGTLRGGSRKFPLKSDCYVGVPTLEHPQEGLLPRLILAEGATLEVHTTDSERARMVVTNDQRDEGKYVSMAVEDADGLDLGAVVFDYFRRGGILLADMDMRRKWEAASFGEHNEAESADLFARIQSHLEKGEWRYPEDAPVPELSPIPRVHVKGRDTVRVTLTAEPGDGGRIRYTLDGTVPEAGAKLYDGPITLTETTVVRARCFKDRERLGPPAGANYVITTPEVVEPDASGKTEQGLELTYFGHAAWHTSYGVFDKPPKDRSGVKNVDLSYTGGKPAALQFTGYLDIDEAGIYRFEAVTDKPSAQGNFARMWLAGRPVFEHSWYRVADDDVRLSGVVRLRPGLYTLKIQAILQGSRLELLAEGPDMDRQPIPAEALRRPLQWHATVSPDGGLQESGRPVRVRMDVRSNSDTDGVEVRYTLDGTEPTSGSAPYEEPLTIEKDTTVRARCFRDGEPLPGQPAMAKFIFLGGLDDAKPGLVYRLYEGGWSALPAFDELDPADSGTAERIEMDVTDRGSNFGLVFDGYLTAPTAGEYTFYTTSDDGSALYIDGKKVVDNDGAHGMQERSGTVTLDEGPHRIRVEFFQGGGGKGLEVHWKGPGIEKQAIPAGVLKH